MKFKVGDKVRIRKDLEIDETYKGYAFVEKMKPWWGMLAEIKFIYVDGVFRINLDEGRFFWTDEMLEPFTDETDKPEEIKPLSIHTNEGGFPAFKTDPPDNGLPHTPHYMNGLIETIDVIKMALTPEEFRGFLKGNVLKYQIRAPHKHETPDEDYQKAKDYYDLLEDQE